MLGPPSHGPRLGTSETDYGMHGMLYTVQYSTLNNYGCSATLIVLVLYVGPQLVAAGKRGVADAAAHAQSNMALLHVAGHVPLVRPREATLQAHPQAEPRRRHGFLQLFHHPLR